ncbi:MAG: preprotein translocase subunit SecY [Bdellovibrionia bacterium]
MSAIDSIAKNEDLKKRIIFTLIILAVYRIGCHVPTPGVNGNAVAEFFKAQSGSIFGVFNLFSGGALERFSIFALGIMPYISSSIIFQLLTAVVPYLESLQKEGEQGRKKINQYTRYGTVVLAIIQGYGISTWLKGSTAPTGDSLVLTPFVGVIPFEVMTIITLTAGTCFIMWLGEQITERGIGNGASLIIFTGIATDIPPAVLNSFQLIKNKEMSVFVALAILVLMIGVVGLIIFLEVGQRRIPIESSQRGGGKQPMGGKRSHLPLKLNFSGVIPPIFASSLLMFPATVAQFVNQPWLKDMQASLTPTGSIYNILFVGLIVFFSFFYVQIVFRPNDVADNLKKYGAFIPGIRAGKPTADYIQRVLDRITVGGAIYLSIVCVLPTMLIAQAKVPFYFGGTSLIILVGVALDTSQQIQSYLISQKYDSFMRGAKIKGRRVQTW